MKKILALTAASLCSAPAMAGIYANVETNTSYTGADYQSRATDLHVGFENTVGILDWYAQGGRGHTTVGDKLYLDPIKQKLMPLPIDLESDKDKEIRHNQRFKV